MSKVVYEVAAKTGKYIDKNGQEKNRWTKCGVILQGEKGLSLKLEVIPVGFDGWLSLFEPKERQQNNSNNAPAGDDFAGQDIPF